MSRRALLRGFSQFQYQQLLWQFVRARMPHLIARNKNMSILSSCPPSRSCYEFTPVVDRRMTKKNCGGVTAIDHARILLYKQAEIKKRYEDEKRNHCIQYFRFFGGTSQKVLSAAAQTYPEIIFNSYRFPFVNQEGALGILSNAIRMMHW